MPSGFWLFRNRRLSSFCIKYAKRPVLLDRQCPKVQEWGCVWSLAYPEFIFWSTAPAKRDAGGFLAKSPTRALTTNPVIDHFGWNADL
jgi:hypothetical protein